MASADLNSADLNDDSVAIPADLAAAPLIVGSERIIGELCPNH